MQMHSTRRHVHCWTLVEDILASDSPTFISNQYSARIVEFVGVVAQVEENRNPRLKNVPLGEEELVACLLLQKSQC